jgi:hypothetical protein
MLMHTPPDADLDVAPYRLEQACRLRQEVGAALWEPDPPCPVATDATIFRLHAGAVDAHRAVCGRDVQRLHGAVVAEEQLRLVAGEVEAGGMVAAGLDAKRVGDADVAAAPGAVVTSSQPTSACCRSWYFAPPNAGTISNMATTAAASANTS